MKRIEGKLKKKKWREKLTGNLRDFKKKLPFFKS